MATMKDLEVIFKRGRAEHEARMNRHLLRTIATIFSIALLAVAAIKSFESQIKPVPQHGLFLWQ